jgi:hypothetical protein
VLGRSAGTAPLRVHRLASLDSLAAPCHMLFVSGSEERRTADVLERASAFSVLTVSDIDGFASSGGVIGFVIRRSKIRFQINPAAATRQGLTLSAKLMRLAEIVDEDDD